MAERLPAARVLAPEGLVGPAAVVVEDGRVAAVEAVGGAVPDRTLAPGFVDLQVNGFAGVDFMHTDRDGYARAGEAMIATGTSRMRILRSRAVRLTVHLRAGPGPCRAARPGAERSA